MKRRNFLLGLGGLVAGCAGLRYWPEEGVWNPCNVEDPFDGQDNHAVLYAAWAGIDSSQVWDCHTHLIGTGDSGSGIWVNDDMESLFHPVQFSQFQFYLNAGCTDGAVTVDEGYVKRLVQLGKGMAPGSKFMLLAFDYHHDESGQRVEALSPFYTPNEYTAEVAARYPKYFEWIASIHPYREDAIEALEWAVAHGARAVKWLPGAMGIDPSSSKCDAFYEAAKGFNIPLLIHSGDEQAVHVEGLQALGNPLLIRYPLDKGVRVIAAHCASLGSSVDIDQGPQGPVVSNFELFTRLMDEPRYEGLLYGDISAVTQINRPVDIIAQLIERDDWHHRLLQGSDYPLPGIMPLFSVSSFVEAGYLPENEAQAISKLRLYNPMLFDFVLKRRLQVNGKRLAASVFETRRVFEKV